MEHFTYNTRGVCASQISFALEGDIIHDVRFVGGCNGNLQAISKLVEGMSISEIEEFFHDINCAGRGTSCSAQLAIAARAAYEKTK